MADLIEEIVAEAARPRYRRPGRDAVRPRRPPRALERRDPPRQPRPDRRQRRARRRDRGRLRRAREPAYDAVRDLPLVVEGYELDGHSSTVSSEFTRKTTVIRLVGRRRGGARRGRHLRRRRAGRAAGARPGPAARRRVDDRRRSRATSTTLPLFEHEPEQHAYLDYRRWAFESAALDLALRQAGRSLGDVVGRDRAARDVRRVGRARRSADDRRGSAPFSSSTPAFASSSTRRPTGRTRSSPSSRSSGASTRSTSRASTAARSSTTRPTPTLYRRVIEAFPDAWLEDPALTPETEPVLEPQRGPRHLGRDHPLGGRTSRRCAGRRARST